MSGLPDNNAFHRCSVVGTFGELRVTAAHEHVVVDVRSRNYDTAGRLHCDHALARLPLEPAKRLRDLLDAALAASTNVASGSLGIWGNAALKGSTRRRRAV